MSNVFRRPTRTQYRWVLAGIGVTALALIPLSVLGWTPAYLSIGLFILLAVWIGVKPKADSPRDH